MSVGALNDAPAGSDPCDPASEAARLRAVDREIDVISMSPLWPAGHHETKKPRQSGAFLRGERRDLNPRPPGPQPGALPAELRPPSGAESSPGSAWRSLSLRRYRPRQCVTP